MSEDFHIQSEDELESSQRGARLERAATWLSVACAVHCLLTPVAVVLLPTLGASHLLEMGAAAESVFTVLVIASVSAGAAWGFRRHRDLRILSGMLLGLLVYLLGHSLHETAYGQAFSVLGALALAAASFASARLTQHVCEHDHAH